VEKEDPSSTKMGIGGSSEEGKKIHNGKPHFVVSLLPPRKRRRRGTLGGEDRGGPL